MWNGYMKQARNFAELFLAFTLFSNVLETTYRLIQEAEVPKSSRKRGGRNKGRAKHRPLLAPCEEDEGRHSEHKSEARIEEVSCLTIKVG